MISPAAVVVNGGTIAAVNPASPPAGAAIVDPGGVTLLPGSIDMHVHVPLRDARTYRADIAGEVRLCVLQHLETRYATESA